MDTPAPSSMADYVLAAAIRRGRQRQELRRHVDEWQAERESLRSFIPAVHKTDKGQPAYPPAHLLQVIDALQDDSLGNTVIIAPPGSAKTNTTIAVAEWLLGRDPTQHIGFFSNTDRQAYRRSVAIRDTISKPNAYQAIFPDVLPDTRKGWAEFEWYLDRPDVNDKDASLMAAGVGSAIQGSRLGHIFLDDIADRKNMATALQRQKVLDWLVETVMSRLDPTGRVVMICTRWHPDDPAGWAIKQGWTVIHLKAITDQGESYWPERWPVNHLACPGDVHGLADDDWMPTEEQPFAPCWVERDEDGEIVRQGNCQKYIFGSRAFNLTFQGETTDDDSAIFKRHYWRTYKREELTRLSGAIVGIFVDLAHEEKTEADYTVAAVWRFVPPRFFVQDRFKARLEFPEVLELLRWLVGRPTGPCSTTVRSLLRLHGVDAQDWEQWRAPYLHFPVYIEETPGSKPLIQTLRREVPGVQGWRIEGRSKRARAEAVVNYPEAGNVYLPEGAFWLGDFIEEHTQFPAGEHDDQVDTTTMALLRFTRGGQVNAW